MTCVSLSGLGTALGYAGAAFVWEFIYGIGDRVVTDELYAQMRGEIPGWGAAAGACSGFAVGLLPGRWPAPAFALLHPLSVLAGICGGNVGWRAGLAGYFGMHVAAVGGCSLCGVTQVVKGMARRSSLWPKKSSEQTSVGDGESPSEK